VSGVAVADRGHPDVVSVPSARTALRPVGSVLRWLQRPLVAGLVLLALYGALSMLNDARGSLGTDTGGKIATLRVMDQRGTLDPDIGYWAERFDPTGDLHPLFYTDRVGDRWVNVTTLPMLVAAAPLYHLGGGRLILLLPMLGSVACAFAARALCRRHAPEMGWWAFWAVGLATPVTVYALDFWEHSIGLAGMLWGVVWLQRAAERRTLRSVSLAAVLGGLCFGLAATMRTEAFIYAFVATAVTCVLVWWKQGAFGRAVQTGAGTVAGLVAAVAANLALEELVLGTTLRAGRTANNAAAAGAGLRVRIEEALTTTVGLNRMPVSNDRLVAAVILGCTVLGIVRASSSDPARRRFGAVALAGAGLVYLVTFAGGLGFISGLLTASPLAVAGVVALARRGPGANWGLVAVAALPLVWAFGWVGGANPQWGGRYVLTSSVLLAVLGIIHLAGARRVLAAMTVLAAVVTAGGVAWLSQRSHGIADAMAVVHDRDDPAVISTVAHLLREGGAFYEPDRRWLTATDRTELRRAVDIVERSSMEEFTLLSVKGASRPRQLGDFTRGHADLLPALPGWSFVLTRYHLATTESG
jgi:hypothetical protein